MAGEQERQMENVDKGVSDFRWRKRYPARDFLNGVLVVQDHVFGIGLFY